jgi:hypothetical protein
MFPERHKLNRSQAICCRWPDSIKPVVVFCSPIAGLNPEGSVGHLFELRNEGKIRISLYSDGGIVECTINSIN